MPRPKSIIKSVQIDIAEKAHNCKHNKSHRIQRGDKRLKLRKDRAWEHYCTACAKDILERDIQTMNRLLEELNDT